MKIKLWLKEFSTPIDIGDAIDVFENGSFLCVVRPAKSEGFNRLIEKYLISNILSIEQEDLV